VGVLAFSLPGEAAAAPLTHHTCTCTHFLLRPPLAIQVSFFPRRWGTSLDWLSYKFVSLFGCVLNKNVATTFKSKFS